MPVYQTALIYAGIPLLVVLVLAAMTLLPGGRRRPRWKSGQPWPHEPLWYEPHPEGGAEEHGVEHGVEHGADHGAGGGRPAIGAGATAVGALTAGASAAQERPELGPLGGARGTW